jgi:hypothetical protein
LRLVTELQVKRLDLRLRPDVHNARHAIDKHPANGHAHTQDQKETSQHKQHLGYTILILHELIPPSVNCCLQILPLAASKTTGKREHAVIENPSGSIQRTSGLYCSKG